MVKKNIYFWLFAVRMRHIRECREQQYKNIKALQRACNRKKNCDIFIFDIFLSNQLVMEASLLSPYPPTSLQLLCCHGNATTGLPFGNKYR